MFSELFGLSVVGCAEHPRLFFSSIRSLLSTARDRRSSSRMVRVYGGIFLQRLQRDCFRRIPECTRPGKCVIMKFCVDSLLYWRFRCPDSCRLSRKYVQNASRFTLQQSRDFWALFPCFFPLDFHSVGGECLGVLNARWHFVFNFFFFSNSSSSFSFFTEKKSHGPGYFLFLWTPDSTFM